MPKALMIAVFAYFLFDSSTALGAMGTAEKWVCTRDGATRTVRLYAESKGSAPCKIFYSPRAEDDQDDAKVEAQHAAGTFQPTYYSSGNGGFCVRKLASFMVDLQGHRWSCTKL